MYADEHYGSHVVDVDEWEHVEPYGKCSSKRDGRLASDE